MNKTEKWDRRFLQMAKLTSTWSKDPSTQCGAVITKGNRVISLGFNGFPKGTDDSPELYRNRDLKLKIVLHSEVNAILFANTDLEGCTIYVWPMPPCCGCASQIIQSGIKRVVSVFSSLDLLDRWGDDFIIAKTMYAKVGIELKQYAFDEITQGI